MKSFRQLADKADLAVSNLQADGGYLNPIQANTFIRMLQEQPTIVNEIRTVPMNAPLMEINKIGFGQRILHAGPASGAALTAEQRSKPTTDQITLLTKPFRAEVHLPYDVLEDNIERGNLEDTVMAMIAERASLDLEENIIIGDLLSADPDLNQFDGLLKLITTHTVDYSGDPVTEIDKAIFKAGIKAMPNKYMRNRPGMRFWVSPDVETEYADSLANRHGGTLSDTRVTDEYYNQLKAYGVPVRQAPLMPDDKYVFTYPQNVILGVQRQIMIESDRDIRTQVIIIVVSMRLALQIETEDASVKCIGLAPNGTTSTTA